MIFRGFRSIGPILASTVVVSLILPLSAQAAPKQQDSTPPIVVTSARALTEVVGDRDVWMPSLSSEGEFLAYTNQNGGDRSRDPQICVYTFANAARECSVLPEEFFGMPYQLQWSPDSATIAFSENPIETSNESDIWVLDVESMEYTNLTDDGFTGMWRYVETDSDINIDYLPMWDKTDGSIVFWRAVPAGNMDFSLALYRLDSAGGDPVELRAVDEAIPYSLPTFAAEGLSLDGPSALAPDGSAVAAIMTTPQSVGPLLTSLWLIPLSDVSANPVELIPADVVAAALPEWQTYPATTTGVSWTGDGEGAVVFSTSPDVHTPFMLLHYVDVATGDVTPIVDFSGIESPEAYYDLADGSELPWRVYSPWAAGLSATEDSVLMVNQLGGSTAIFNAPLPADGALPEVIASRPTATTMTTAVRSSRSSDGKIVMYGTLLQTETP